MAKKEKTLPAGDAGELSLLQAKHDALVDQVLVLENNLEALQTENAVLRAHIDRLQEVTTQVANSASIAPAPPPPPERPTVEIDGRPYRFKVGEVRLNARQVVKATELAAYEARLLEVFAKYPGLFEKL